MADSPARHSPEIATVALDLAFSADAGLAPELMAAAGPWCAAPDAAGSLWQRQLASWLGLLQDRMPARLRAPAYSLGLTLVDDVAIAALNSDWRQIPGSTDVLAFAVMDDDLDGAPAVPLPPQVPGLPESAGLGLELGDIVISLETAARQAPEQGHKPDQELLFLASHGLLHLLGWDHPDQESLSAMLQLQEELCSRVSV